MILSSPLPKQNPLRQAITNAYRMDETAAINYLLAQLQFSTESYSHIAETAKNLILGTRERIKKENKLSSFLHQYDLSSEEGIALMCLAEALLRIPDTDTIDRLISDKISSSEWLKHLAQGDSLFTNAATWSLMLTGKIFAPKLNNEQTFGDTLKRLGSSFGTTLIRPMVMQGMKMIGNHFVMGQTINEAMQRAKGNEALGYRYSYDMLGEAARTAADAERYFQAYLDAIRAIKETSSNHPIQNPGISIKLSALHPRYEYTHHDQILKELTPKLLLLSKAAKDQNIGLTVDAEEADRLDLSLDIIEAVFADPSLDGWEGFGLAVQAYQKRAPFVIDWLADLSKRHHRRLMVRLVKGAYWDAEIKLCQLLGLEGYPVYTRKNSTDVSYIVCAKKLIAEPQCFYSQFGTHNAQTVASILELMGDKKIDFEFQCLHGMGEALYGQLVHDIPCRIYAPVGSHKDLLGYLVRRLLENGANTSFINRLSDDKIPIEYLIENPVTRIAQLEQKPHPRIPLPTNIYGSRINSSGLDLSNSSILNKIKSAMDEADQKKWEAGALINGKTIKNGQPRSMSSPINHQIIIGSVYSATLDDVQAALAHAEAGQRTWGKTPLDERAACLERAADLFEENRATLMTLLCKEGGKQIIDCVSEIREAVDFCRYYAKSAKENLIPLTLPGPTGEFNQLSLHPRGIFACISPWNFPLAIFTGQVVAALVCGNAVIAKPAEQTSIIGYYVTQLLHQAGIPENAIQLLPGQGSVIGSALVADERVAGIMFTGSTETAKLIQQTLANRSGPMVPFIAETGGQNAMIVDSSALPEQVVMDVITSAFNSAGQRCSALRVLFLQKEIAPSIITMLKGAMAELHIGDPGLLTTDVGPVIDEDALHTLQAHLQKMKQEAVFLYQTPTHDLPQGYYFSPAMVELPTLNLLKREVFGPILHVIRYEAKQIDNVLASIVQTGYGLTFGIHSRINATVEAIINKLPVGNIYVNRNIVGAVVGVQPFGGEQLSGTGPKAGGPHYLPRLCVERCVSINTTAAGGNATLVTLLE
jgi:RHH-type transcriptional regulator, proline utilization regulon repressor / proline dehydrogenase / delta 1-pyrroline-5-carboxylate dehydrogenase